MNDIGKVLEERGERYGKFVDHARISQSFKGFVRNSHQDSWDRLSYSQKESLDMIFHKIARILNGDPDYADSWVDIAGYAKLIADELSGEKK